MSAKKSQGQGPSEAHKICLGSAVPGEQDSVPVLGEVTHTAEKQTCMMGRVDPMENSDLCH